MVKNNMDGCAGVRACVRACVCVFVSFAVLDITKRGLTISENIETSFFIRAFAVRYVKPHASSRRGDR